MCSSARETEWPEETCITVPISTWTDDTVEAPVVGIDNCEERTMGHRAIWSMCQSGLRHQSKQGGVGHTKGLALVDARNCGPAKDS